MRNPVAPAIPCALLLLLLLLPTGPFASREPAEGPAREGAPGTAVSGEASEAGPVEPSPGVPARRPGEQPPAGEEHGKRLDPIADEYLTESQTLLESGDVAGALVSILRARARSPGNGKVEKALGDVTGALRSRAYYAPSPVRVGKGIPSPLQFLLTYAGGSGEVPVPGIPVEFDFARGTGVLTGEAVTNDLGIAKCYVESVTEAEEGVLIRGRVILRVDGRETALETLERVYEFVSLSIFDSPHVLLVSVEETGLPPADAVSAACAAIRAAFGAKGFSRFDCAHASPRSDAELFRGAMDLDRPSVRLLGDERGAKVLLLLSVRTAFLSQPTPGFHFHTATLSMKMVDVRSFRLYFQDTREEQGAGPDPETAERQAVRNALAALTADLESYLETLR
jgi:hypothetical protein